MQNFNLANYYDKSLVDVHKNFVESISDVGEVFDNRPKKKPLIIALSFVLMFASAFVTAYYLHINRVVIPLERIPSIADRKSNEENRGYVRVHVFEFDNSSVATNLPIAEKNIEGEKQLDNIVDFTPLREDVYRVKFNDIYAMDDTAKGIIPKYEDNVKFTQTDRNAKSPISSYTKSGDEMIKDILKAELAPEKKPVQVASTTYMPVAKNGSQKYSVRFNNVNKSQYSMIREIASRGHLISEVNINTDTTPRWTIYKEDKNGEKNINGINVTIIQSFDSNTDALEHIEYLKVDGGNFVVKVDDVSTETYNIKLCCTDLERAKSIATESRITDGVIRIVREY